MVFGSFTESVFFIRLTDHGCSSQSLGHEDAYLPDCKIYIVESLQSRCIFAGLKSIFKLVPRHGLYRYRISFLDILILGGIWLRSLKIAIEIGECSTVLYVYSTLYNCYYSGTCYMYTSYVIHTCTSTRIQVNCK